MRAAHFTWQIMSQRVGAGIVEDEIFCSVLEEHVFFMKDGGPLERGSWLEISDLSFRSQCPENTHHEAIGNRDNGNTWH